MKSTLAVLACVVLTVAALPVAVADQPSVATVDAPATDAPVQVPPGNNSTSSGNGSASNRSMGAAFSTFTQSTAADADSEVDGRMWGAAWNGSADNATRERLVEGRTNALDARLEALRDQRERLMANRDEMNPVAYRAQLAALTSRLAALGSALNQTQDAARQVGVNTTRLETLRANASELTGPEIAAMARELGGGPPEEVPGMGPPDDRGNGNAGDCQADAAACGNETGGQGGEDGGQHGNVSDTPGNGNVTAGPGNGSGGRGNAPGGDNGTDGGSGPVTGGPDDGGNGGHGGGNGGGDDTDGAVRPVDAVRFDDATPAA